MIEFACHTWAFNKRPMTEALGTIARMGFRYVDIGSGPNFNVVQAATAPRETAAALKQELQVYNLQVSDFYLLLPRISISDASTRQKELDIFKALLPFATLLGTPGITVSPGLVHAADDTDAFDRTVDALSQMVEQAHQADLRLSIEPHVDSMAQTPEGAMKLVNAVSGLEITLDWAQMVCQNVPHDDIVTLLPSTRHIQMRQAAPERLQTPLAEGAIDLLRVMGAMKAVGYEQFVCVEYLNTPGWHGAADLNPLTESTKLRDTLRDTRDTL